MKPGSEIQLRAKDQKKNNFDLLRLAAALMVLFAHAYVLMHEERNQIMFNFAGNLYFLSSFGLMIFFTISGFLVTQSAVNSKSALSYSWKRMLRIYPAYIVLTLLMVFVVGPVFTTLDTASYFSERRTLIYLVENLLIMDSSHVLPGVFNGNSVNASAWTLSFEIKLYILLLLLYLCGILHRRWLFTIVYCIVIAIKIFVPAPFIKSHVGIDPQAYYDLGFYFITGSAIFLWNDTIGIHYKTLLVSAAAWFLSYQVHFAYEVFESVFWAFLVLWLALKTPVMHFPKVDISYGIYIYAWPVQMITQILSAGELKLWQFNVITLPIIILLATLSWHWIERKALAQKNIFQKDSEKRKLFAGSFKT